jgi:hypothetical protein
VQPSQRRSEDGYPVQQENDSPDDALPAGRLYEGTGRVRGRIARDDDTGGKSDHLFSALSGNKRPFIGSITLKICCASPIVE